MDLDTVPADKTTVIIYKMNYRLPSFGFCPSISSKYTSERVYPGHSGLNPIQFSNAFAAAQIMSKFQTTISDEMLSKAFE